MCDFDFSLVFLGQSDQCWWRSSANYTPACGAIRSTRDRVHFRNLTKNADNSGIFGLCTPRQSVCTPLHTPEIEKSNCIGVYAPMHNATVILIELRWHFSIPENRLIQDFSIASVHKLIPLQRNSAAGFLLLGLFTADAAAIVDSIASHETVPIIFVRKYIVAWQRST